MCLAVEERIIALGFSIVGNTPEEFGKQIAFEIENIKAE
jgi:hypothetical protein